MSVNPQTKKIIFLVWVLVSTCGMWVIYNTYPPTFSGQWLDILAFLFYFLLVGCNANYY